MKRLPTEATPEREDLIFRVRSILRRLPGVMLFQDASALPAGNKYDEDVGYPDILGVQAATCPHRCRTPRLFAFIVQVHGERSDAVREHWLARLRGNGWVTAIINDPAGAKEALALAERARP